MGILAACSISFHALAGFAARIHPIFLSGLGLATLFNAWQVWKLDVKNHALCDRLLCLSYIYGVIVFLSYLLGAYFYCKWKKNKQEKAIEK